jgi:hypothetical protein
MTWTYKWLVVIKLWRGANSFLVPQRQRQIHHVLPGHAMVIIIVWKIELTLLLAWRSKHINSSHGKKGFGGVNIMRDEPPKRSKRPIRFHRFIKDVILVFFWENTLVEAHSPSRYGMRPWPGCVSHAGLRRTRTHQSSPGWTLLSV